MDDSVSILVGYLLRLPHPATPVDDTGISISSDNPTDVNPEEISAYNTIDFEMVLQIEDPGSIVVFVDRERILISIWSIEPSTKAADIAFPMCVANIQYQYEVNKDNWMIASLGVHFNSISIGPCIIDVIGSILNNVGTIPVETTPNYPIERAEERTSGLQPSMFEEPFMPSQGNERIQLKWIFTSHCAFCLSSYVWFHSICWFL